MPNIKYLIGGGVLAVVVIALVVENSGWLKGPFRVERPPVIPEDMIVQENLVVGTGAEAVSGKTVSVHYVGTLQNGTKFDSSYDRGEPFSFTLGAGQVIEGWEKGIVGMRVGGKRKLVIPPALAYGSNDVGNGLIPPSSTLIFEVELLGIE